MRILVISDIHANLTALETVVEEAGKVDAVWCLGDIVGYGPDPNECVELIRNLPNVACIIGNHDAGVVNHINVDSFNPEARYALVWTQSKLSQENLAFLRGLPQRLAIQDVTLAHGSPRQPVWEYVLNIQTATQNFDFFQTPLCFIGHTHLPVIYSYIDNEHLASLIIPDPNKSFSLYGRAIVNPGSVGQPRDRDPRAAFAIFHPEDFTWDYHRVPYNIKAVQLRMADAGLPERHINRLAAGW